MKRGNDRKRPRASSRVAAARPRRARIPLASALRDAWHRGYSLDDLRADVLAGTVVALIALPLSMGLAIAIGVPPAHGISSAVVAGASVALLGGCRYQVTGPTAAFVVILGPVVPEHGLSGLFTAGFMAGAILLVLGIARLGHLVRFVPLPVIMGVTAGIATVIATLQLDHVLGLALPTPPHGFVARLQALWRLRASIGAPELVTSLLTFAVLIAATRAGSRAPPALLAIVAASFAAALVQRFVPALHVATISSELAQLGAIGGLAASLPGPGLPWGEDMSFARLLQLLPVALAVALLGALESLVSATLSDRATGTRHDPDGELVGLGIGNMLAACFSGVAATGALARTTMNVRAGARSPLAAVSHAILVLSFVVAFAPLVSYVPMATLGVLLLRVAWDMSDIRALVSLIRTAPRGDVVLLCACYGITVLMDMLTAVAVGVALSALLFMRRMADSTTTRATILTRTGTVPLPASEYVVLYEIGGPVFFATADRVLARLSCRSDATKGTAILDLSRVPVIDSTSLAALVRALQLLLEEGHTLILASVRPQPRSVLSETSLWATPQVHVVDNLDAAIVLAANTPTLRELPATNGAAHVS
jgi:sulfate permease, SulP family